MDFQRIVRSLAIMTTISSYFIGSILMGIIAGRWLDNHFGTGGLFLAGGLLLGIGAAVTGIYYAVRRFLKDDSS
ncbi:AtpZ/AtpI family protein [Evansella clarkii]|uniref:AtpZ/AtpI family protein n=1 Tax=Evansella clarkii TaxID=79879 RepID=UPI000B4316DE|nr:AtpZ/AtpI family protein [Evansella clarkii]